MSGKQLNGKGRGAPNSSSRDDRGAGDGTARGGDGPKEQPGVKQSAVLPCSLESNIGKPGYNKDGIRQIIQRPDMSYYLVEPFKGMELWMGENGCELLMAMWSGPNEGYLRYDPDEFKVGRDVGRYNDPNDMAYRDEFKDGLNQCRTLHPKVVAQELKAWNKL
jgi:hypothetical protein